MPVDHREVVFEAAIEDYLVSHGGYIRGHASSFDAEKGIDPSHVIGFIRDTQEKVWADLERYHPTNVEQVVIDWLVKSLESMGTLHVLRHGFKVEGRLLRLAYFKPAHTLNPDMQRLYGMNRLIITRQVHYSTKHPDQSIDIVGMLNGIPVFTAELKNPMSGQTVENAKKQYMARDHREPLLRFKRGALVHFAVDTDEVYMTTQLAGPNTFFLPFNKGNNGGAGNPDNPDGYKTEYLWTEILQRDAFLDLIANFIHLEVKEELSAGGKVVRKERIIFPRYHQWDVVRKFTEDAKKHALKGGKNYLAQHSTGSGKSNSIAWLAYRLSSLHTDDNEKVFHSVIVVTDRVVLDRQLQDTIYQFEHKEGVVRKIDQDSRQLAAALKAGVPIIITTLQKFPFVTEHIGTLPERRYAVIIDEAHSSQSGESARKMKEVLAASSLEEAARLEAEGDTDETEEEILRVMKSRGRPKNVCFFAFTATPRPETLEMFGEKGPDGKPRATHLYSMRQAIEEGFILDVLKHYTTYKTFYKLVQASPEDPTVEKRDAVRALARFMSLHPHNLAQKTEIMVEHFRTKVRHKIGGKAKAMLVTSSRLHAKRYKESFEKYIKEKGYSDLKVLVAFSGKVIDEGQEFTEVGMNQGIKETELPAKFATDEYQILLVADKYQTGFDQPLLHTMYVDKKLSGLRAVQTLSRLNRTYPGKDDTFVLDFVNEAEDIRKAFEPYYEQTVISETADPHMLYDLQHKLDEKRVYTKSEVEGFCKVFFKPKKKQTARDHAAMNSWLDPAVNRFKQLSKEEQDEFRGWLVSYRNLYAYLTHIMEWVDPDLEKLYAYVRFLLRKLPRGSRNDYDFDDEVALEYYRIQKMYEGSIELEAGKQVELPGVRPGGSRSSSDEQVKLSTLIEVLNERFGTNFTEADQLFFDLVKEDALQDEELEEAAKVNTRENFRYVADRKALDVVLARREKNDSMFELLMNDKRVWEAFAAWFANELYDAFNRKAS